MYGKTVAISRYKRLGKICMSHFEKIARIKNEVSKKNVTPRANKSTPISALKCINIS